MDFLIHGDHIDKSLNRRNLEILVKFLLDFFNQPIDIGSFKNGLDFFFMLEFIMA